MNVLTSFFNFLNDKTDIESKIIRNALTWRHNHHIDKNSQVIFCYIR